MACDGEATEESPVQEKSPEECVTVECSKPPTVPVGGLPITKYQLTCDQSPTGKDYHEAEKRRLAQRAHDEEFLARTGMTPKSCYRLVLVSLMLRLLGGGWIFMVAFEYARYYVINDLTLFEVLRTATSSPQYVVQAFLFPFWGVVSDRVSRKKVLAAAAVAACSSAWMLTLVPCVEVYIFTRVLNLIADVGGPIRDAMLRDIFSKEEWEGAGGGATGIKARMMLISQVAFGVATVSGLAILKFGEKGIGFPNEYTVHKHECGTHCVQPGRFSWEGPWHIDGSLRLLMLMGTVIVSLDAILVVFFFPETLPVENRLQGGMRSFMKESWQDLGRPWNNVRVFATTQLRVLMFIRFIGYVIGAGGGSIYLAFYNRFQFDTFTMTLHSILAGTATWLTTACVPRLVDRFGDLRGVWIPGGIIGLINGLCWALVPPGYGFLVYAIWPMFAGPAFALEGFAPELMSKLIPGDLQGTYQTAKSFIFRLTMAIFSWPWTAIFVETQPLGFPLDGVPIWLAFAVGFVALLLCFWMLRIDPRRAIERGDALQAFYESHYAKGEWYRKHSNVNRHETDKADSKPDQAEPASPQAKQVEEESDVKVFVTDAADTSGQATFAVFQGELTHDEPEKDTRVEI